MDNPHAHNPLVVKSRGKVPRNVLAYITQTFEHVGMPVTLMVQIISDDYTVCSDYKLGVHILPLIPNEKLRVSVQVSSTVCYLCRIVSPEMRKKDLYDGLTARLTGEVFRIDANNPPPHAQMNIPRKLQSGDFGKVRRKLALFRAKLSKVELEEKRAIEVLKKIQARAQSLCAEVNNFVKSIHVSS